MNQGINLIAIYIGDGFGAFLAIMMLGTRIWKNGDNRNERKLIHVMLYTALISCVADLIAFACDGRPGTGAFLGVYLGNLWLYLSNMILGTAWIMVLITHISRKSLPRAQVVLTLGLDVVGTAAILVNFFVPAVFSVSAENVYARGPVFWLYIFIEMVFTVDGVVSYFTVRKKNPEAKYFPVWQFVIPMVIGIAIQSVVYGVATICPATTIAICGLILGMFNENEAEAEILRQNEENARIILQQQKQVDEALALAESANRAKTAFLFSMSHDIRTPLNAITGFTNMAVKHIDDREKTLECLTKIRQSEGVLMSMINNVLEVSQIESGHTNLVEQCGDVYYSFANIENTMRELAETKDIQLSFEFGEIRDRYVYADFSRCLRVFVNIISNAIKYTPAGGFVQVRCEQLDRAKDGYGTYQYTFADNGIGMSEEFQKHIFEQFSREQTSTVSGIQGTGLGMAVVKSFVDLMDGTVSVQSKVGEGSTFTITLPFKLQDGEKYTDPVTGDIVSQNSAAAPAATVDFTGKKVLLVEDNELNREIALEILEEEGFSVEEAENGQVAVQILSEKGPDFFDFILMDIQMPVMNGYEATKAIRERYPDHTIPIIAVSANAFAEDKAASLAAGMDDHVAKPINVQELLTALAKYI